MEERKRQAAERKEEKKRDEREGKRKSDAKSGWVRKEIPKTTHRMRRQSKKKIWCEGKGKGREENEKGGDIGTKRRQMNGNTENAGEGARMNRMRGNARTKLTKT